MRKRAPSASTSASVRSTGWPNISTISPSEMSRCPLVTSAICQSPAGFGPSRVQSEAAISDRLRPATAAKPSRSCGAPATARRQISASSAGSGAGVARAVAAIGKVSVATSVVNVRRRVHPAGLTSSSCCDISLNLLPLLVIVRRIPRGAERGACARYPSWPAPIPVF